MKNFKKILAVLCSATMIVASAVPAFAADPDTTAGKGSIFVYSVNTVTLPTSVKIAFNPNEYNITPKAGAAAVTDQIVSLKYGIASTANMDKKISVSFEGTATANSGGTEAVTFVDDIKKAQAYNADTNPTGAKYGEHKIYLEVVASTAAATKTGGTAFAATDWADETAVTATKTALADVDFTKADKGAVAFTKGAHDADATIAYKLVKATYTQKTGDAGAINIDDAVADLSGKFDLTTIGSVVGFTFAGAMNKDADWAKANINAISIQPVYEITNADGSEELLSANGGFQQIKVEEAAAATDDYKMVKANGAFSYTFVDAPTGSISAFTVDGNDMMRAVNAGNVTYSNGVLTINATATTNIGLATGNHTIVATIGGSAKTLTITN